MAKTPLGGGSPSLLGCSSRRSAHARIRSYPVTMTTGRRCHPIPRPATTGVLTEGFGGSSFPWIAAACPQTAAAREVSWGTQRWPQKGHPGGGMGQDAGAVGRAEMGAQTLPAHLPLAQMLGGSPRQRGGGVRGADCLR